MFEWWRWEGWPTAAEWQAWWGFGGVVVAGVLLYVAWKQLSGLAESNRELKRSNELLTESNKEISRPVVSVEYLFEKQASRNYTNAENKSTVYIVVSNVGATPARDVRLTVTPSFQKVSATVAQEVTNFLNELFSGQKPIKMLSPGQRLKYVLDDARDALTSKTLPSEYAVNATYTDLQRTETFDDEFVLEMSPWAMSIAEVAPMKRISKDIQFVAQSLRDRDDGLPGMVKRVKELKPAQSSSPRVRIAGRPSLSGRTLRRRR